MTRYGRIGAFGQIAHPRIRGDLDPRHVPKGQKKVARLEDYKPDEETYFVPSFSIRRHLHRTESSLWEANRQLLRRHLGRGFETVPSQQISLKIIEQHRFIKNVREAGIRPSPEEIKDIAYSIRDLLTNELSNAHSPLPVPLGSLNRFGYKENSVGYEIAGWRGDRAPYGQNDEEGLKGTHSTLLAERQQAVGAIALAFEGKDFKIDGIAPSPHLTIARSKESIPDYQLRDIRGSLGDIALDEVYLGDPVIDLRLYRGMPTETIYVRHAWESLALMEA